jgi:tetratricopeptide (TPR) repeat protein
MKRIAFVLLVVVSLATLAGFCNVLIQRANERHARPIVEQERPADPRPVQDETVGTEEEETPALKELFDQLGEALRQGEGARAVEHFDIDRMHDEIGRQVDQVRLEGFSEKQFRADMRLGLSRSLGREGGALQRWKRLQITRVNFLGNAEATLLTRARQDRMGESVRMVWWVKKGAGRWRIYDYEEGSTGLRLTTMASLPVAAGRPRAAAWVPAARAIIQAKVALLNQNLDEAERVLLETAHIVLPPPLAAVRSLLRGRIAVDQERYEDALKHLDQAETHRPGMAAVDHLRALCYNGLGQYEKALMYGRKYLELIGDDADGYLAVGNALTGLERDREAAEAFLKGLDDQPDSFELLSALRVVLPAERKKEWAERFVRLPQPADHFEALAAEALADGDAAGLDALVSAYQKFAPGDAAAAYYGVHVLILKKQFAEIVPRFRAALAIAGKERRDEFVTGFLDAMLAAERPLEAYRAAPDAGQAFRHLADQLPLPEKKEQLSALMEAHRRQRPKDIWLLYYTGRLHEADGALDQADQVYAAGQSAAREDDTREAFRSQRVLARFQAGRGLSAYADVGPPKATFDQLANLFDKEELVEQLEELLAAHRKKDPRDEDLVFWFAEADFLHKRYDKVIEQLRGHRLGSRWRLRERAQDRLVRALVRLSRGKEAVKEVRAEAQQPVAPILVALAHAAVGDAARTITALEECVKQEWDPDDFYRDPDLAPLLRGDRLRAVRDKYPDPKAGKIND